MHINAEKLAVLLYSCICIDICVMPTFTIVDVHEALLIFH